MMNSLKLELSNTDMYINKQQIVVWRLYEIESNFLGM